MGEPWQPGGPEPRRGGFVSRQSFPKSVVRIIHAEGTLAEEVHEEVAHVRDTTGFFDVEAPIRQGDVLEVDGSDGTTQRRRIARIDLRDSGPRLMRHAQVTLEDAPEAPPPRPSAIAGLRAALAEVDTRLAELTSLDDATAAEIGELIARLRARLD
jgi:hypothetical protein